MKLKKWIPLIIIVAAMIAIYASGIYKMLTFDALKAHRMQLLSFIEAHPFLSPLIFILIYVAVAALSIPGATFVTLFGGFLFPFPLSTLYVMIGATGGALCIFLAAKTAFGDVLREKAGPLMQKMGDGFQKGAVSYMFFLRLVPVFPFWLVNLAPAFFGVRAWTFIWTTFIGIIPGTAVYTEAGAGLGDIFDKGESFSLGSIFNTKIKIALVLLGLVALIPIVYKKIKERKERPPE